MTPDALRAAIAADCPHRLDDYDWHRDAFGPNEDAFLALMRTEYAISRNPTLEARINDLHAQAEQAETRAEVIACFQEISRIRREAAEGLK
ncbi:hypothetical protein ACFVYT_24805 [Streptomyces sp. NPDC058290]|uniref:hypothetical protein n=1 Tax=Streptomyces sp. NPDC058290 TaxID=3346426 RepID=UPI0036E5B3CD